MALFLALVATVTASAQETTGTLTGKLTDTQGLAVPGATVTVTGPQGARSFTTDTDGRFNAPFLTPGTYSVRAELTGFKAVDITGISVQLGQTTDVGIKMEVGGLTETISVTASQVVIDASSTTTGAVLSSDLLERVPVGRRFSDALYLAPGVSSGGSVGRANPSISGGTGLDNQYVVDGVNVTNQGYGALGSYSIIFGSLGNSTPFDFIKEIQVKTGGYDAEFGQSTGGVVNVVTKSGTNAFHGSVFAYSRPGALQADHKEYQSENGTVQFGKNEQSDAGFEVNGPIVRNRLFFFGAFNPSWETREFKAPEGFPLESMGFIERKRSNMNYSAKATWQLASNHRIDASFFGDPSKGDMGPQRVSALLATDTSRYSAIDKFGGNNQTVRYDGVLSPTFLLEASWANARNQIVEVPAVDQWLVTDRRVTPNVRSGGIGFFEAGNDSKNRQFKVKGTNIFAGHQLSYGVQYDNVIYAQINDRTGPTFTTADGRTTATGAQIDILPDVNFGTIYRVVRANYNTGRETDQKYYNFFVQDSWKVTDRLTINPGVRYEAQNLSGTLVQDFKLENNWAPRVGVIYDVLGNGRSKLYGNYGVFYARIPNDLAARALSADDGVQRADYFDAQLTRPIPNGVATQTPGGGVITNHLLGAGVGADVIDPDAKLSFKNEFVLGYEFEVRDNTSLGARYIYRNIGRVLEDVAAAPMVAYDLHLPGVDTVEYILTNPSPDTPTVAPELGARFEDPIHTYNAVEVTLDRRFSGKWQGTASYRWSRLHGTFEGFYREDNGQSDPGITSLYDFPTNDPSYTAIGGARFGYPGDIRFLGELGKGPLPLDRTHQLKFYGNYAATDNLGIGLALNGSSGKPLTPLAGNPNYGNGGEIPTAPRGSGIETVDGFKKRTPFEYQLDAQASYNLRFGDRRVTLLADAFNLFNLRRVVDYNAWTDVVFDSPNPDFGTPTSQLTAGPAFQAPFMLRVGARFEW
ncbi:MAG TPA: TonB-dependent receptor [Vicinamibacterales bacterium]|nr:TonB-dependent receptor [Vicinamibacterales bacterium]